MTDTMRGLCGRCGRETEWSIGHAFDDNAFTGGVDVVHTFVCKECGAVVKASTWSVYQRLTRNRMRDSGEDR